MTELVDCLKDSWKNTVLEFHCGHIPSESTLHSVFFSEIKRKMPHLKAVCEPYIALDGQPSVKPDIVLVHNQSIIAFIELKMSLLACPNWECDLQKLSTLIDLHNKDLIIDIFIAPKTGKFDINRKLSVSSNCLAVFAAIAQRGCSAIADGLPHKNIPMNQWLHLRATPDI